MNREFLAKKRKTRKISQDINNRRGESDKVSWDEYFMRIADEVASKSKDPSSKNGCVIVDAKRRPVSFGYNGAIQGADESKITLTERPMKYYFVIHSEMNAVLFAGRDLQGCTLYNKMATCENCLKYCIQAGITRFCYRQLRVSSYSDGKQRSMTSVQTDEAVLRLLAACSWVEAFNIENGKSYAQDILDSYDKSSEEYKQLSKWALK